MKTRPSQPSRPAAIAADAAGRPAPPETATRPRHPSPFERWTLRSLERRRARALADALVAVVGA